MPWSKEKIREYRSYGDGRDKKRASDKAYAKKNRDAIRERANSRPIEDGAPSVFMCRRCGVEKPFTPEFFVYRPAMRYKLTYTCRKCGNDNSLLHQTMKKYGMTLAEAAAFRSRGCAICGTKTSYKMSIDHCHKSGKVRDVLCGKCNIGIGQFNEDTDRMKKAIAYIEAHR